MEITLVNADKLKIVLSREDMQSLSMEFENIDYANKETKELLLALLEQGKARTGFQTGRAKLFVEVFPDVDDGCVIYFTALHGLRLGGGNGMEPVIFAFDDVDALCEGAGKLFSRYSHRIYKSSLYRYHGQYLLVLFPLDYSDRLSVLFLSEFGSKIGEGDVFAAYIEEHAAEIIRDNAVDTLAEHFYTA